MKTSSYLLLSFFLFSLCQATAQVIPSNRRVQWSQCGYPGTLPNPQTIVDVTSFGAVGDGVTDNFTAVTAAINSLSGTQGVIYFPTGNFLIGSSLNLPDSVILRGVSSDSTHLSFNFNGTVANCINITGTVGTFTSVNSGYQRGSNFLVVADPSSFGAGDYAELQQANGSWDTQPVSWADHSIGQILHLTSVNNDTLFFDRGLRIDYDSTLQVEVRKITPAREVGIECLGISRDDSVHAGVCINIYYTYAVNCWVRGVESSKSIGSHIEADACSNLEFTGNYIHHNYEYDGTSTHGYGITLFMHTGQCKVENNILKHLRHCYSMQCGANGNVIAYNYSLEPNRSETPSNFGADISMHGHYTFANLFEGNILQNLQIDQTWGPTGPFNTFFRNRAELYGIIMTSGTVESDSQNFVGNEVTNTGLFLGNYLLAGAGHFEYGNNIKGTITPAGTSALSDSSYYLDSLPSFWNGSPSWPSVGLPNALNSGSIPARDRYLAGGSLTVCSEQLNTAVPKYMTDEIVFSISPNPVRENLILKSNLDCATSAVLTVRDLSGRLIFQKKTLVYPGETILEKINASPGIYILSLISATLNTNVRFVLE